MTQVQLQRRSLPQILREMEIRSELANRERLAEEERNRQRELEQRRRIDRATAKLIESNRIDVLNAQVTTWRQARQLDDYLAAMAARIEHLDDPAAVETASEWLAWAKAYAARSDPLNRTLAMPADPEPTPAALPRLSSAARSGRGNTRYKPFGAR